MSRVHTPFRPGVEGMDPRLLLSGSPDGSAAIVTGLYRQILQRDPDPLGLVRFSGQLDAGWPVRRVAEALYASGEFRSDEVSSYFTELLDRPPTAAERARWTSLLVAGAPEERVIHSLLTSSEYYAKAGAGHDAYVRALYVDLLGRGPTPSELTRAVSRLDTGTTIRAMASEFISGTEFRQAKVREVFQAVLDRQPVGGELADWTARWRSPGGLKDVSLGILDGAENGDRLRRGAVPLPDLASVDQLRQILQAPYSEEPTGFVNLYNALLGTRPAYDADGDPIASTPTNIALWTLMKSGGMTDGRPFDEQLSVAVKTVDVGSLIPLQSEIDIDKSLGFVLGEDPARSDLQKYLDGGTITPFGGPILTGGGGTYIADGHHRWSSLYVINPYAQIAAVDLGHEASPQDYLKVTQMAVGAELGFLQVQKVEGQNLFTIGREAFDAWVTGTIRDGDNPRAVLEVFLRTKGLDGVAAITEFLWANVERMRQFNRPVAGATSRDYMPQPPGGDLQPLLHLMESGRLNVRLPAIAQIG